MKKFKKFLKLLVAVIIIIAVAFVAYKFLLPKGEKTIITTSTLRDVMSISELSTGEFYYNGVVSVPKKFNSDKIDYSLKYDSTVKAGINTDDIEFEIDSDKKTITPILPEIKINDVIIDSSSISAIPADTDVNLKTAISYCKEDALNEANSSEKLKETAESNLQDSITAILTPILKESGYEIVW